MKSDGRFVIRGLRPGLVHLSLEFEEMAKYFSIVRIEYPDDSGETMSILPASMTLTPKLPSFCTPTIPKDVSPLPKAPTVSPEVHLLPPAPPNESPSPTIGSILQSSDYRTSPLPIPVFLPQEAPVAVPSELLGPRFPGDLPPLQLSEHGLSGVRLVLSYKNGCIRGHVTYKRENLDCDKAGIFHRSERGSWSTSTDIDPNGDFFIDGLAPGEYEISILSETKSVVVDNDSESSISFVIGMRESDRDPI